MELRTDAPWALVVPTSMGVRLTPEQRQPVHTSDRFLLQATSAETNVASVLSSLGEPAKVLTAFVAGSPGGSSIINFKSKMVVATGPNKHFNRISGRSAAVMFFNEMNQSLAGLKPRTVKGKCGAWHFGHPQQTNVKSSARFNVADNQRHVINVSNADRGFRNGCML